MALKLVVTAADNLSHVAGSTTSGGTFVISTPASLYTKIDNQGVYRGTLDFTFSLGNSSVVTDEALGAGAYTPGTVYGSGSLDGSAQYVEDDGDALVLEGDSGSFSSLYGTYVPTSTGVPVPNNPLSPTDVEFSSVTQSSVHAE